MIKVEHLSAEKILLRVIYLIRYKCKESIKLADATPSFFEYVPRQLHISCAIRCEMWTRNKEPNELKLLTLYVEYRMNVERKMSDIATRGYDCERAE